MYLGHDLDLSRSRDVIGHVIIFSAVCGQSNGHVTDDVT